MAAEALARTTFSTSRLLDFASEKELTAQTGYGSQDWPLVAVKELIDNALDATEEQGIAPVVTVVVTEETIEVTDNGAGVPPETVELLLDFSIRASSREAYVAPDRGAQGNALKTIVAMPFVLDGESGRVDITGGGVCNQISFAVDRIEECPVADVERIEKTGSSVKVYWPLRASSWDDSVDPFLQNDPEQGNPVARAIRRLCRDFAFLNPHLTITLDAYGEKTRIGATAPTWAKWMPSTPTSPHWDEAQHLERLIGAYITHERRTGGGNPKTVREFVSEFKGLTATAKQKAVLEATGLQRAPLSSLVVNDRDFDHDAVHHLLKAMKDQAKPVRPLKLGAIGRDHVLQRFEELGIRKGSFEYKKFARLGDDGLPQVTEVAFAALENEENIRELVTGVNWSAAWVNPFRRLGTTSLDSLLTDKRFSYDQPVALLVHVAHPRVEYSDRGKSAVVAL